MKTLAIIPARKGSRRCPGKNLAEVGGVSLLDRAIDIAEGCGFSRWVVMTDLAVDVKPYNLVRPPGCLLSDDASVWDAIRWTYGFLQQQYDAVVILQPTSPLRTISDVKSTCSLFKGAGCAMVPTVHHVEKGYRRNGICYVLRPSCLTQPNPLGAFGWLAAQITPPERSIDINTPEDLERARQLWEERHR